MKRTPNALDAAGLREARPLESYGLAERHVRRAWRFVGVLRRPQRGIAPWYVGDARCEHSLSCWHWDSSARWFRASPVHRSRWAALSARTLRTTRRRSATAR